MQTRTENPRPFTSPLARRLAADAGLDLLSMTGSGPRGRIVKRDVEAALADPAKVKKQAAPAKVEMGGDTPFTEVPNSTVRKVIARRLSEAKRDIPHFYLTVDCEIDALLAARADLNAAAPDGDDAYKLSVNDFVVKAVALAMRQVPEANASWTEAAIRLYQRVDVAVAVATEQGLITPVLRDADRKGLSTLSNEVKALSAKARAGRLTPEEYQGGGFTISNLGMYGIKEFSAIINPPQSCLLAVGMGEQRPVVRDGKVEVRTLMTCTLSVDHRSVDGAVGARFLAAFKRIVERPMLMVL